MEYGCAEPQRFRGWVARQLGLHFDDTKLEFLSEVLLRCAQRKGLELHHYLDRLEGPDIESELQDLVLELTVPETYFFRHIEQLHAFADVALPDARAKRTPLQKLNVLSVGCASGEEPYSLAMLVHERCAEPPSSVAIHAVDINTAMLSKAARGYYSPWALRGTPPDSRRRWFRSVGKEFALEESIRAAVTFQEVNLAHENAELWKPETYDVIFCRNVLMYLTQESGQAVVARLTSSIAPGGYLFLGHAETLRGLSDDYELCHTHGSFYYQRKDALEERQRGGLEAKSNNSQLSVRLPATLYGASVAVPDSGANDWLEAIQNASERIQALTERSAADCAQRGNLGRSSAMQTATQLRSVWELLKEERFPDALDLLGRLPAGSVEDPDILLLRAVLLTHCGQLSAAEVVSAQLLERDELNAGAHYLLALCRESAGDRQGAHDHDRAAIHLDPGFAMPRLHLGLMARRAGDTQGARRELDEALLLLKREDDSRLLLFGGGFGREALIALCRGELLSAGGLP
jgi:chemotaxis protein methyltransferase CheR